MASSAGLLGAISPATTLPGRTLHSDESSIPSDALVLTDRAVPAVPGPTFYANVSANTTGYDTLGDTPCNGYGSVAPAVCDPWASDPNLLHLSNGKTGLVYAVGTTLANPVCGGLADGNTSSRLVFTTSGTPGQTWAGGTLLGQTPSTCPYYQAIEPAFTTNSSGGIVGVYVGANSSFLPMSLISPFIGVALDLNYSNRSSDALIFESSTNDGATFSNGTVLSAVGPDIARPAIATFGNTIYVVYEKFSNTTVGGAESLPGPTPPYGVPTQGPVSVWMVTSTDGGATWGPPGELPGENSAEFNTSLSPSVAVSSTGEVAVAYLTNRSCIAYCGQPVLAHYGDDVVVVTSTSNGTRWSPIRTIYSGTGEPYLGQGDRLYGQDAGLFFLFQYAPAPVVAWNTTGSQVYVAWSGSYNISSPATLYYSALYGDVDYAYPAVYAATSPDGGVTWAVSQLTTVGTLNANSFLVYSTPTYDLDPGLSVSDGHAFVTYLEVNQTDTSSLSNCGYYGGSVYDESLTQWLQESPNGQQWGSPNLLAFLDGTTAPNAYLGPTSSVLVQNGTPSVAFSFPVGPSQLPWAGETSGIQVATPYEGSTLNLTFQPPPASGSAGGPDGIGVDGVGYEVGTAGITLTGIPADQWLVVNASTSGAVPAGDTALPVGQGVYFLSTTTTLSVGSELFTGLNLTMVPNPGFFAWRWSNTTYSINSYADFQEYWEPVFLTWESSWYGTCTQALVPVGVPITVGYSNQSANVEYVGGSSASGYSNYDGVAPTEVVGYGSGSYSGTLANFTINASGPLRETLYLYASGEYDVDVAAPTLPVGTGFQFRWDGEPETSSTGAPVPIENVSSGFHSLTNITAPSSRAGWVYEGQAQIGNPVYVPQFPTVNLSFAYLNVSAPAGTVSFVAPALPPGTDWQLSFNGTVYASSTRWINVTAHPGTYPVHGFPATSEGGDAGYVPAGVGPEISIVPGDSYVVNFTAAYEVATFPSAGGTVTSGGSHWVAAGSAMSSTATPAPGWAWIGWSGTGAGSYTGPNITANLTADGPVLELANFAPLPIDRFTLTVAETGIPTGTPWSLELDGAGYAGNTTQIVIPDLAGCSSATVYHLFVPDVNAGSGTNLTRYVPSSYPTSFCVGGTVETVVFSTQYALEVAGSTGGTGSVSVGSEEVNGTVWMAAGATADLAAAPDPGYYFTGWVGTGAGSYSGPLPITEVVISDPVTETATFAPVAPSPPAPRYTETFTEEPALAPGTVWSLSLGPGLNFSSSGSTLIATDLPAATYRVTVAIARSPGGQTEYAPADPTFPLKISGNGTSPIEFTLDYWVVVQSIGPGSVSPSTGWRAAGTNLSLAASPTPGDEFLGWTGNGVDAYNGSMANATVVIRGPLIETAAFGSAPALTPVSGLTNPWTTYYGVTALAVGAAVVGLTLGAVLGRRRRTGAGAEPPGREDDEPGAEPVDLPPGDAEQGP